MAWLMEIGGILEVITTMGGFATFTRGIQMPAMNCMMLRLMPLRIQWLNLRQLLSKSLQ